ncbi:MAG: XRE family transcriptional regulator [Dehalococcoidia bacterium]|nr:XRE family transcriptional regulator [Dehalococcoidia bacterium]
MIEALITSGMLRWARKRSYATLNAAADKLKVKPEKLNAWEEGYSRPTFRQAKDLARKLRIPFGYLYLSEPPEEKLPLPDLRTKLGTRPHEPSPDFLEVLYDALRKQEWYHDYLKDEQADNVPFVGRFNSTSPIKAVAEDVRRVLRIDDCLGHGAQSKDDFFNRLVQRAEEARVLVMRSSIVGNNTHRPLDIREFQGFAVVDNLAPLVFINTNDFLAAQIFTLVHELAHIWMGIPGVSNLSYLKRSDQHPNSFERVTDAVAAEALVPADVFDLRWNTSVDIDENLDNLSRHYCVSKFVILRRAYELKKMEFVVYQSKYSELGDRTHPTKSKKAGGNTYASVFYRNSSTITSTLLHSVSEGRMSPKEASQLLNIRALKLYGLERHLVHREIKEATYA